MHITISGVSAAGGRLFLAVLLAGGFAANALAEDDTTSEEPSMNFQWRPALTQSLFAFTIAHAERFSREQGTRDAIQGPFWQHYAKDIQNLHGWQDGDGKLSSYIAHPMEGAMAGYIERQNDPKYRTVEFGGSQRYWISVTRSLAFSTLYNIMWSLSPYGEAGLGNVDLHAPPGVVDPVGSELMGTAWMIGEDAIDRYLIRRIEGKYRNPVIRAFARGGLNPIRSYSNLLRFKVPWYRDGRSVHASYTPPADDLTAPKFSASAWPHVAFELLGQPYFQKNLGARGSSCVGGGGEGAVRISNSLAMVFDVDGCTLLGMHSPVTGDMFNYVAGPRWMPPVASRRWIPYVQVLAGGAKITHTTADDGKREQADRIAEQKGQPMPSKYEFNSAVDVNGFTVVAGGGLSYEINELLVLRVANFAYQHSWVSTLRDYSYDQGLRFSFGLALRLGSWREPQ